MSFSAVFLLYGYLKFAPWLGSWSIVVLVAFREDYLLPTASLRVWMLTLYWIEGNTMWALSDRHENVLGRWAAWPQYEWPPLPAACCTHDIAYVTPVVFRPSACTPAAYDIRAASIYFRVYRQLSTETISWFARLSSDRLAERWVIA